MKCCKCKKSATFEMLEPFCDDHWVDWWTEGWDKILSKEDLDKEVADLKDYLRNHEEGHVL